MTNITPPMPGTRPEITPPDNQPQPTPLAKPLVITPSVPNAPATTTTTTTTPVPAKAAGESCDTPKTASDANDRAETKKQGC